MIHNITYSEITEVWESELWTNRSSPIKSHSSMMIGGGYDMSYYKNNAYFWALMDADKIIAVESGHKCCDHAFRIRGLWVNNKYRGMGLAGKLFEHAESIAIKEDCDFIWSYPRNSSLKTYIKYGYSIHSGPIIDEKELHGPYWFVHKQLKEQYVI